MAAPPRFTQKPPNGLEPLTCGLQNRCGEPVNPDDTDTYETDENSLASYLALLRRESPDLATVVESWNALPDTIRAGIMAIVQACDTDEDHGSDGDDEAS